MRPRATPESPNVLTPAEYSCFCTSDGTPPQHVIGKQRFSASQRSHIRHLAHAAALNPVRTRRILEHRPRLMRRHNPCSPAHGSRETARAENSSRQRDRAETWARRAAARAGVASERPPMIALVRRSPSGASIAVKHLQAENSDELRRRRISSASSARKFPGNAPSAHRSHHLHVPESGHNQLPSSMPHIHVGDGLPSTRSWPGRSTPERSRA